MEGINMKWFLMVYSMRNCQEGSMNYAIAYSLDDEELWDKIEEWNKDSRFQYTVVAIHEVNNPEKDFQNPFEMLNFVVR